MTQSVIVTFSVFDQNSLNILNICLRHLSWLIITHNLKPSLKQVYSLFSSLKEVIVGPKIAQKT